MSRTRRSTSTSRTSAIRTRALRCLRSSQRIGAVIDVAGSVAVAT
jgi:hypothetical protein